MKVCYFLHCIEGTNDGFVSVLEYYFLDTLKLHAINFIHIWCTVFSIILYIHHSPLT